MFRALVLRPAAPTCPEHASSRLDTEVEHRRTPPVEHRGEPRRCRIGASDSNIAVCAPNRSS